VIEHHCQDRGYGSHGACDDEGENDLITRCESMVWRIVRGIFTPRPAMSGSAPSAQSPLCNDMLSNVTHGGAIQCRFLTACALELASLEQVCVL
jgi:hypothetical protein